MKLEKKLAGAVPAIASSADAEKVSLTIKGVLVGLIPLLVLVLNQFDVKITADMLLNLLELGLAAVSAVMVFIGAVRKVVKSLN